MFERIFPGDSEMAGRMRALDWSRTTLGSPEDWPENLRIALSICLTSRFPMQVWWGADLAMLYNDAYIPFLGSGKHPRALGRSARDIWSEIWHQIGPMLERVVRDGIASWSEDIQMFFNRKTAKEEVYVSFSFSPIFAAGGDDVEGAFCACTETTEKMIAVRLLKARAEELARSEERFRAVADNIPQLAWMADSTCRVDWFNRVWLDYTGTTLEQNCGAGWKAVHHPDYVDAVAAKFERHLQDGLDWEDTFPLRGKDGQYRWFLSRMKAIRDESGKVVRFFGTNTDVTEQRAAEEALKESDRRKTEFLAMLAHELRNPLAPIRNAVRMLQLTGGNGEAVATTSAMMERQIGQLVRLVDDLLDVSRISRGKIELCTGRIELASVVNHAVEAVRPQCQSLGHELTVTLPPTPVFLNGDPTRLAQVIGNLLNNACKFSEKGGRIALAVERAGDQAVIRVRDGGIGIAADQLPRIFEMFVQVDTSLERSVSGLGIGLTLVKTLVEMHGGTVAVHSAGLGRGTEFVVRLPILMESPTTPVPEPTDNGLPPAPARRILVVDDNRDSATTLARLLKLTGHETHTAYDGVEAVAAAATFRPDVVLLDIGLPKLNGYEVCRQIRGQPWGERTTLIALTGWGQEEDRRKSCEVGFDDHLVKPVDHAVLVKLLASLPSK